MTQRFRPTRFPAPTADTEAGPEFHYAAGELLLTFTDYMMTPVRIRFRDVVGLRWSEEDDSGYSLRDDDVYEVHSSFWIESLQGLGVIPPGEHGYRHLKIGFNELGSFLEVVFKGETQLDRPSC